MGACMPRLYDSTYRLDRRVYDTTKLSQSIYGTHDFDVMNTLLQERQITSIECKNLYNILSLHKKKCKHCTLSQLLPIISVHHYIYCKNSKCQFWASMLQFALIYHYRNNRLLSEFSYHIVVRHRELDETECAICLNHIKSCTDAVRVICCNKLYHLSCLTAWFNKACTCPDCRFNYNINMASDIQDTFESVLKTEDMENMFYNLHHETV